MKRTSAIIIGFCLILSLPGNIVLASEPTAAAEPCHAGVAVSGIMEEWVAAAEADGDSIADVPQGEETTEAGEGSTAEAMEGEEAAEEGEGRMPEEKAIEAGGNGTAGILEEEPLWMSEGNATEYLDEKTAFDEEIFRPNNAVLQLDDYWSITYEDCRGTGKTGEWRMYTLNKDGQYINKYGEPIEVKKGDGKWHMEIWMSPDCEEDLQYLSGLQRFLGKCDMDNLVVTIFWYPYPYKELTNEKLAETVNRYGISEEVCAVNIWDPSPSTSNEKGYFGTCSWLVTLINSVAASYGYSTSSGNQLDADNCPCAKNEFMVFYKDPEGELSSYSIGIPRTGLPGMSSSECSFLIEDRLASIAVSLVQLKHENFPYPSAYDEYPPKPAPESVSPVQFKVEGVFGGRNVTFSSDSKDATIYYSSVTSNLTVHDAAVHNGETLLFENFYGTVYARAYKNGVWGNVSRLVLKIPVVNKPVITCKDGRVTIRTSTPDSYIYYTTDGSAPSLTNGKLLAKSGGSFTVPGNCIVRAIAVRSCFTNSQEASAYVTGGRPDAPAFAVNGVIGGREVTFYSSSAQGEIYYSYTTSNITTNDKHLKPGETVLFQNYYGTVYAKTYANGQWSNVSRLILRIPKVNTPTFTTLGTGRIKISCSTPDSYIYYTTDGSYPSPSNGRKINASGGIVQVGSGVTVRAVAVRSCFTNSDTAVYCYWD